MKRLLTVQDEKDLAVMAGQNWGSWTMPCIGIGYRAVQEYRNGQTATIVRFDYPVTNTAGFTAIVHRVYPISNRKPNGLVSAVRS